MSNLLLGADTSLLSITLLKTSVFAVWYATLFWLPVRGVCAVIDRRRGMAMYVKRAAEPGYRVGLDVLPPM